MAWPRESRTMTGTRTKLTLLWKVGALSFCWTSGALFWARVMLKPKNERINRTWRRDEPPDSILLLFEIDEIIRYYPIYICILGIVISCE